MKNVIAIIPIKQKSERVENKNFRDFMGNPLFYHILMKLNSCKFISKVIINTDSADLKNRIPKNLNKVEVQERPDYLYGHHISGSDIIKYVISKIDGDHFLQTHVTNPLLSKTTIEKAISRYFDNIPEYDSLFTVDKILKRVYLQDGTAVNHKKTESLQTQYLDPLYSENSNLFIFSRQSFIENNYNRIGCNPYMFEMNSIESIDIDYIEDLVLASVIYKNKDLFTNICFD
jgi:CMP-N-acetylneuraminic acid synthetase